MSDIGTFFATDIKRNRRIQAAKKAWRTRRRLAKPSKKMREWLVWLARYPENVIVQRWDSYLGSGFSFGVYPETAYRYSTQPKRFTRGTFWAMQKRGWVECFHRTENDIVGINWSSDHGEIERMGHRRYWRITTKGRKACW
jgi:hypothetical protein